MSNFADQLISSSQQTGSAEFTAIITALLYVVLAAMNNKWCWPFGIISSAIYVWFNFHLKLYNDAWLSVYYVAVGFYGWIIWQRGERKKEDGAVLHKCKSKTFIWTLLIGTAGTIVLGSITKHYTDSPYPYFDSALSSFSLIATWMTARRILENWIYWIVIDAAYVIIYLLREAPTTSLLFAIYTIIALFGYFKWKKLAN